MIYTTAFGIPVMGLLAGMEKSLMKGLLRRLDTAIQALQAHALPTELNPAPDVDLVMYLNCSMSQSPDSLRQNTILSSRQ